MSNEEIALVIGQMVTAVLLLAGCYYGIKSTYHRPQYIKDLEEQSRRLEQEIMDSRKNE